MTLPTYSTELHDKLKKRADLYSTFGHQFFVLMKEQVDKELKMSFDRAIKEQRDHFFMYGPRYIYKRFTDYDEYLVLLKLYDQAMVPVKQMEVYRKSLTAEGQKYIDEENPIAQRSDFV